MKAGKWLAAVLIGCGVMAGCRGAEQPAAAELQEVAKPLADEGSRQARQQPTVPDGYKEVPFLESAPEPELTAAEKQRGFVVFQRPITEPVYPQTRPLAHERITGLSGFAAPGEFEPLTFSLYPVRGLTNLRVRCSPLQSGEAAIGAAQISVRLLTYWNIGFPMYTSRKTYRRTPELLEAVDRHSSPAGECQRYWIRVQVPEKTPAGLYTGTVTVMDDDYGKAVQIPVTLRVLDFKLQKDPRRHFSAYFYPRNRVQYGKQTKEFTDLGTANEYRAMVEYGLDMLPTLQLRSDDGKTMFLDNAAEMERMLAAGMKGPLPVTADNAIARLYTATVPGGKWQQHWLITKQPPPEFDGLVTAMFKAFEAERKAKGWPEMVCCPMDEVAASQQEFGQRVFAAVRAAGIRTYATKNPVAADARVYDEFLDIWCSQPFSVPFEKIVAQKKYEYWSYPNHNAGEIKDRVVMCKGGRMTYGFGLWRSGYTTLIPWHWAWTPGNDQFDYLRGPQSGCGMRIADDGSVTPAVYWECFREGIDDARYVYTLQQAIVERDGSADAQCLQAVAAGKALLQATWDAVQVQEKYLDEGMWPSAEFNARRWQLAQATARLLNFPAVRAAVAPAVLVADTAPKPAGAAASVIARALQAGNIEFKDLGGANFADWKNQTAEGATSVLTEDGKTFLRWKVGVDHKQDGGGENGEYPIGWPRVRCDFPDPKLDMRDYDYLAYEIRIDSDRDEVTDDSTPVGFTVHSNKFFETGYDLGGAQRVWLPVRFAIKDLIAKVGRGDEPWKAIDMVQMFISESSYADGTRLVFDFGQARLLRFKAPMITALNSPACMLLPAARLAVDFEVLGTRAVKPGSHVVAATLTLAGGNQPMAAVTQDLADNRVLVFDAANLTPGKYTLKLTIADAAGKLCATETRQFEALAGPVHGGK